MDHAFKPSLADKTKCLLCKRAEIDHTDEAKCEACPNTGRMELFADMLLCKECIAKEMQAIQAHQSPEKQEQRVLDMHAMMDKARAIDQSINVRADIFNAETVAIEDIRKAINADSSIENKQFALAKALTERYNHYKDVVFELNQKIVEETNKQRATQSYLNSLAKQLRAEEREKLKLADINYKPEPPKKIKPAKPKKAKVDFKELMKYSTELALEGIIAPVATLQMMCEARDMTPEQAANMFRKKYKEKESENNGEDK
jgi:hypothetical protein